MNLGYNMDLSTRLLITPKGKDEVRHRTYRLGIKKRCLLLLLDRPQPIRYLVGKSVLPQAEIIEQIRALVAEEFVALAAEGLAQAATEDSEDLEPQSNRNFQLCGGIIISEARFLLVDFCLDNFGTQSQRFADEIRKCANEGDLRAYLGKIVAATHRHCPNRIPDLMHLVMEINSTA